MAETNHGKGDPETVFELEERPTLKTIARLSGLAVPTVSRALNDAPDIGEETKRRIKEIALKIGYRPNRAGVRLRTGRTSVISLVISTDSDMMNHTGKLISSIAGSLRGTSYHLIITPYFKSEDPMAPIRYILETGSADGIILNQIETTDPRVRYLKERDFPFATHGRTENCADEAYYDFDNTIFGALAVAALAARGCKRLCMIPPPFKQNYARNMIEGASAAARQLDVSFRLFDGPDADSPGERIEAAAAACLSRPDRPDAFIVPSAAASMATISGAEDVGLQIGRDFQLMSKEATPFLHRFRKEIMTVSEDVSLAGTFLAKAILHRINHRDEPPMQRLDVPVYPPNL